MALKGTLNDVNLANLISVACSERSQSCLRVRSPKGDAVIFLAAGGVVHAELDSTVGAEVVYEVLSWTEGEFELEQDVMAPAETIDAPLGSLLLHGMQRLDESPGTVPEPDLLSASLNITGGEEQLCATVRGVAGVAGAVIVAQDGTVLAYDLMDGDGGGNFKQAEQEGAVTVFVGNAASEIGETLVLGQFLSAVLDRGEGRARLLVLACPDYYVGLLLENQASPALVASRVGRLLG